MPNKIIPIEFKLEELWDIETDDKIDYINPGKANQKVKMKLPIEAETGYIIRRKKS